VRAPAPAPASRVRAANDAPVRGGGAFVLLWMTAARRTRRNFALQHAVARAREMGRPLVVLEGLRCGHRWASRRIHRFVLDGMADQAARFAAGPARYLPYAEPRPGAGSGLLEALAADACLVVADDSPAFFLPRMLAAAAARLPVRVEAVDGCGLLPLSLVDRDFPSAYAFRAFLQARLATYLAEAPAADPLRDLDLPPAPPLRASLHRRWPAASPALLAGEPGTLEALPLDAGPGPVAARGGEEAARRALRRFAAGPLARYGEDRRHPDRDGGSGLSAWLHFGHLSPHAILDAVAAREGWTPDRIGRPRRGSREGWWGLSPDAEAFLDEAVTWRELGFAAARRGGGGGAHETYESLPRWARETLEAHADDAREPCLDLAALEEARSGDPLFDAAQRQLRGEGRLHNYLRMLWGKKVLEWSPSPREALDRLVHLNNRWALDGRDPNSYTGILWCLGKYDRPWAPERRVFGTVRWMSSANTARKVECREYLRRWGLEGTRSIG
jgi:deoxyribodipyrimidine photo-lyase